jgi:hypothetical protein
MYRAQQSAPVGSAAAVQKPAANLRNYDVLRKQADELAKTNHCDEAIKLYTELQKSSQRLTPTERVNWVRCLNQRGREEEAQQRLEELKQEKGVTPSQIQDAERTMDARKRYPETKKSKKAPAAADRAPSVTTESVQQRAAEPPPAQASPPDSTNTKIQKSPTSY